MNTLSQFSAWLTKAQNLSFEQKRDAVDTKYTKFLVKGDSSQYDYRSVDGARLGAAAFTPEGGAFHIDEYKPGTERITAFRQYTISVITPWQLEEDMFNNGRVKVEKINFFKNMNADFTDAFTRTFDTIASQFLTSATSTTVTNTWPGTFRDGLAFASASHTLLASGSTFSNLPTGSALSYLTLQEAIKMLSSIPDERGYPQNNIGKVRVILGRYYMYRIPELMNSTLQPDSANNTVNALKASGMPGIEFVIDPYVGESFTGWMVQNADQTSMKYFMKTPPRFEKTKDPYTDNNIHKAKARFAIDADSVKDAVYNAGS